MLAPLTASVYDPCMRMSEAVRRALSGPPARAAIVVATALGSGAMAWSQAEQGGDSPAEAAPALAPTVMPHAVERIDSTRTVQVRPRERCGESIAQTLTPPSTLGRMAGWIGLGGPSEGELPAPEFRTETRCTPGATRVYEAAHYRVEYRVGDEHFSANVGQRPGATVQVDDTDRIHGLGAPQP